MASVINFHIPAVLFKTKPLSPAHAAQDYAVYEAAYKELKKAAAKYGGGEDTALAAFNQSWSTCIDLVMKYHRNEKYDSSLHRFWLVATADKTKGVHYGQTSANWVDATSIQYEPTAKPVSLTLGQAKAFSSSVLKTYAANVAASGTFTTGIADAAVKEKIVQGLQGSDVEALCGQLISLSESVRTEIAALCISIAIGARGLATNIKKEDEWAKLPGVNKTCLIRKENGIEKLNVSAGQAIGHYLIKLRYDEDVTNAFKDKFKAEHIWDNAFFHPNQQSPDFVIKMKWRGSHPWNADHEALVKATFLPGVITTDMMPFF